MGWGNRGATGAVGWGARSLSDGRPQDGLAGRATEAWGGLGWGGRSKPFRGMPCPPHIVSRQVGWGGGVGGGHRAACARRGRRVLVCGFRGKRGRGRWAVPTLSALRSAQSALRGAQSVLRGAQSAFHSLNVLCAPLNALCVLRNALKVGLPDARVSCKSIPER